MRKIFKSVPKFRVHTRGGLLPINNIFLIDHERQLASPEHHRPLFTTLELITIGPLSFVWFLSSRVELLHSSSRSLLLLNTSPKQLREGLFCLTAGRNRLPQWRRRDSGGLKQLVTLHRQSRGREKRIFPPQLNRPRKILIGTPGIVFFGDSYLSQRRSWQL